MIYLPKIKVVEIPIEMENKFFYMFLFKSNMSKYILKKHPKLKIAFDTNSKIKQKKIISDYISAYRKSNLRIIKKNIQKYSKAWKVIEKQYFSRLSQILDISWPKNRKIIKAYISINPICPRFLDSWTFTIYYNYPDIKETIETIAHECCHFLYFEKWKKIYPDMDQNKFESPHIEWHLSEIMTPIILSNNKIQKLLKKKAKFYEEYENIKIGNISVANYFLNLYKINVNKMRFEDLLKKLYKHIQKNKFDL